jgi:hypothetical protein
VVCALGLVNVGYVTKVCYLQEVVGWCAKRFNSMYRVVKLYRQDSHMTYTSPSKTLYGF